MRSVSFSASVGIMRPILSVFLFSLIISFALADPTSLDCPLRQLLLDFAQQIQPFRPFPAFQAIADALNGAPEANNCSVAPKLRLSTPPPVPCAPPAAPVSQSHLHAAVDCCIGDDVRADGSPKRPFRTLHAAIRHIRQLRASSPASQLPPAVINLGPGVHYLSHTLTLTAADSNLTIRGHNGASFLSGGIPIDSPANPLAWSPVAPPKRPAFEHRVGVLAEGQAQHCISVPIFTDAMQVSTVCPRRRWHPMMLVRSVRLPPPAPPSRCLRPAPPRPPPCSSPLCSGSQLPGTTPAALQRACSSRTGATKRRLRRIFGLRRSRVAVSPPFHPCACAATGWRHVHHRKLSHECTATYRNSLGFQHKFCRAVRARYPNVGKVEFVMGAMQVMQPYVNAHRVA
jgi:hypothetical protein